MTTTTAEAVAEARARAEAAQRAVDELTRVEAALADERRDLEHKMARRDHFASFGAKQLEFANPRRGPAPDYVELAREKSRLTGRELAAKVDKDLLHLKASIAKHEARSKSLRRELR
jgi:hypothetical protein